MKYIKLLLISLLTFFILFTLIGLLFPSSIKAVRAVVINKKQQDVMKQLVVNENWIKWYPYFNPPTEAAVSIKGDTTSFLNDKKELLLFNKKADSNNIAFTIKAWNGFEVHENIFALPINGDSTQTQVVWNETEHLKWYPWERFRGLLMERTKGIYIDTALYHFKAYVEAMK
jgi:hypothetical protein